VCSDQNIRGSHGRTAAPYFGKRLDSMIAGAGCQNIRTRELDRELTILVTN